MKCGSRPANWCNYVLIKNHLVDSCGSNWTRLVLRHSQWKQISWWLTGKHIIYIVSRVCGGPHTGTRSWIKEMSSRAECDGAVLEETVSKGRKECRVFSFPQRVGGQRRETGWSPANAYFHKCQTDWEQVTSMTLIHHDGSGVQMPFSALSPAWYHSLTTALPLFFFHPEPVMEFFLQSAALLRFCSVHWRVPGFIVESLPAVGLHQTAALERKCL